MSESFEFEKALDQLATSNDLAAAPEQFDEFCKLVMDAAAKFQVKCTATQTAGAVPGLEVVTPLGTAIGRMTIGFGDHPHAVALFDGAGPGGEMVPLYAVYLRRHASWSDSRGNTFEQDPMQGLYGFKVGRVTLSMILQAQMARANAEVNRYAAQ